MSKKIIKELLSSNKSLHDLKARFVITIVENRLRKFKNNKKEAAKSLGIQRTHIHRIIKDWKYKK